MRRIPYFFTAFATLLLCLIVTVPVSGCQDSGTDPLAVIVTPETRGALALGANLPSLPSLAAQAGVEERVAPLLESWLGSWAIGLQEGRARRQLAYAAALDPISGSLDARAVEEALSEVESALHSTWTMPFMESAPMVRNVVSQAQRSLEQGRAALERNDVSEALLLTMQSADLLREASPQVVATALVVEAEIALGRIQTVDPYPDENLTRARRLARGARLALAEGDFPRAIRRAYYACQLLGTRSP
jgi:hypothetical protein